MARIGPPFYCRSRLLLVSPPLLAGLLSVLLLKSKLVSAVLGPRRGAWTRPQNGPHIAHEDAPRSSSPPLPPGGHTSHGTRAARAVPARYGSGAAASDGRGEVRRPATARDRPALADATPRRDRDPRSAPSSPAAEDGARRPRVASSPRMAGGVEVPSPDRPRCVTRTAAAATQRGALPLLRAIAHRARRSASRRERRPGSLFFRYVGVEVEFVSRCKVTRPPRGFCSLRG